MISDCIEESGLGVKTGQQLNAASYSPSGHSSCIGEGGLGITIRQHLNVKATAAACIEEGGLSIMTRQHLSTASGLQPNATDVIHHTACNHDSTMAAPAGLYVDVVATNCDSSAAVDDEDGSGNGDGSVYCSFASDDDDCDDDDHHDFQCSNFAAQVITSPN